MGKKQVESVKDLPLGTSIWIFWDEDRTFYKGQVGGFSEDGRVMTVFYPENEEQENIDVEDFENETIIFTLEDPAKEQVRVPSAFAEVVPEVRAGRIAQGGNPLIQQLRKLGKALHDIEDRLPVEGLVTECDMVWQTWRTSVATAKTAEDLAMMLVYLSQEVKDNVTTQWWKAESTYWRILVRCASTPEALQEYIMEFLTQAIDWEAAKSFFPPPAEPYPEGVLPPTPRKHRVTLLEPPRKKRKFESMRPSGANKMGPPKQLKKGGSDKRLMMLQRIGELKKGTKKLKMATVEDGVNRPKKKLKRKRVEEDGAGGGAKGGVNGRPKSAKKVVAALRPPMVMPALPPLGEKLSAEGLDAKDGAVPATVAVTCNGVQAEYVPAQHMVACRCAQCGEGGKLLTCQQFEAHTGSRAKKWKETIRLAAVPGTRLSEWLSLMEKQGASGVAFVAIEKKRVKALSSTEGGAAPRLQSAPTTGSGNADAARLRKAFAAKLAQANKSADADTAAAQGGAVLARDDRGEDMARRGPEVAVQHADVAKEMEAEGRSPAPFSNLPVEPEVRAGNAGIDQGLHPVALLEESAHDSGEGIGAREGREDSPGDDPISWFKETYVSPREVSQSAAALGVYDGLLPALAAQDARIRVGGHEASAQFRRS